MSSLNDQVAEMTNLARGRIELLPEPKLTSILRTRSREQRSTTKSVTTRILSPADMDLIIR